MFEPGQNRKIAALRTSKCVCLFLLSGDKMKNKYMFEAIKQAKKAYKKGDVPVGTVIVLNNKIIAKGYNKKEKNKNAIKHAEIIAIEKACKKLKTWHLEKCELYTTLEPCLMCTGAIIQSRIKNVYYATENPNFGELVNTNEQKKININIFSGMYKEESSRMLKEFFIKKRK